MRWREVSAVCNFATWSHLLRTTSEKQLDHENICDSSLGTLSESDTVFLHFHCKMGMRTNIKNFKSDNTLSYA